MKMKQNLLVYISLAIFIIFVLALVYFYNRSLFTYESKTSGDSQHVVKSDADKKFALTGEDFQVNGLSEKSTKDLVEKALGKPDKIEKDENAVDESSKTVVWEYDGLNITFSTDRLLNFEISSVKYSTARGIKTGDSKEQVLKLYGTPDFDETESIGYYDNGNEVHLVCFAFKDNKVVSIFIGSALD